MVQCFIGALKPSHTHTQADVHTNTHKETDSQGFSGRGCGSREQSDVSVLIFPSTQIKYTSRQLKMMSLAHSCPYPSVLHSMCVCAWSSTKVKLDSHCLPPFNSVFFQNSGDPTGRAESYGPDRVPSARMWDRNTQTQTHTLYTSILAARNGMRREWEREGRRERSGDAFIAEPSQTIRG